MIKNIITIEFSDIAESLEFPRFCKILAELLDFRAFSLKTLGIEGHGKILSKKGLNPLCKFIQQKKKGSRRCEECDRIHIQKVWKTQSPIQYICHAGLRDFVVPVIVNHKVVAVFEGGQFLPKEPNEEDFLRFQNDLRDLRLDQKKLKKLYFKSPFISRKKLDQILELICFFSEYLSECLRHTNNAYDKKREPAVSEAYTYIQEHFKEPILLDDIAQKVFMSPTYLSSLFKKETNTTITDYIQSLRITETKTLLENTQWSITQIAFEVGFSSLGHFYRVFHKFETMTPKEYRKKFQK